MYNVPHLPEPIDQIWPLCFFNALEVFLSLLCQFQISIVVERPDGREIAKPVELRVMVGDANDNRPTFPQAQYHTVVKELAARGNGQLFILLQQSQRIFGKCFVKQCVDVSLIFGKIHFYLLILISGEVKDHHKTAQWDLNNPLSHLHHNGNIVSQQGRGNTGWNGCCSDERAASARYLWWKQIGILARTQGKAPFLLPVLIKSTWCVVKAFLLML